MERLTRDSQSSEGRGWHQWGFLRINLIADNSRYFHVILVNTFDKMKYQCYFQFLRNLDDNRHIAPCIGVVPIKVPSMGQIDLFENCLYLNHV